MRAIPRSLIPYLISLHQELFETPLTMITSIDSLFPRFATDHSAQASDKWSKVLRWVVPAQNPRPQVVVSTSLYFGTHRPEKFPHKPITPQNINQPRPWIRGCKSWRETYFKPFLDGCHQNLPSGWVHRVYISRELQFLIP